MAIRELSYVLHRDPDTGADRLTPTTEVPDGVPDGPVERVIAATHRGALSAALSHTRLPHRAGGTLLCSARHDEEAAGVRVDARWAPDGDWPRWPVDSWRPRALPGGPGTDAFAPAGRLWDEALLAKFAADRGERLAPFLADVRRLFADPAGRQIVLAEEDQETVARWIALACASLPVPLARALTFTTAADDPAAAPQQIVGVGPGLDTAVFDRFDLVTRTHLFRVHDGLGGPGSPRATDPWAELTAWLWRAGAAPRPTDRPEDAFALLPLARRALRVPDWDGLGADLPRTLLDTAARAAAEDTTDADTVRDLTDLCSRAAALPGLDVQPLAAALLRRRLRTAGPPGVDAVLSAAVDLPLDPGTRRAVRAEYGPPPEDDLRSLLLTPPGPSWGRPLRTLLGTGPAEDPVVDDAVSALARALARPEDRRTCADTVALLDSLGDRAFTRRVVDRLARGAGETRLQALRALARSPHADWLSGHLDGAPLAVRLAVSAGRLGRGAYGLSGVDLWTELVHAHLDGEISDTATVRMLWTLVWPGRNGGPTPREQGRVTEVCPPGLIAEAGLADRLTFWLRNPQHLDRPYIAFAREAARAPGRLPEADLAVAQLVCLAHDFAAGREPLADTMRRCPTLKARAGRLGTVLDDAVDYWLAHGMARSDPEELRRTGALHRVATGRMALIRHYGDAVREAQAHGGALDPAALRDPRRVASLFLVWTDAVDGAKGGWRQLSGELLLDVLGAVLPQLDERALGEVATLLAGRGGERGVQAWNKWRQGMR
ncbi:MULTISPECIES: GTPase-associated protein 1-related protein [Streptomyces]|uniref:GTPase-associated protein 1-related protein n=1 Tax=Streptomyces doudnae TaxID=3075536 RepID=A0ABD5EX74_9ACTN|nr:MULTISPECIES: GTPase-associated protein 1-related protein [unclassified Streptomyces]MDT0438455.1 GTPase-associated protein 1-related protein [Streptomyces sp. DSM 41981]MYQ66256.1 hypothetical protein [Streptomyces sp. SID4950]SCE17178.1 hypothetical protein GA0115242_12425 [Streptomyces sp. SolWspMP-5a-2]